MKVTDNRFQEAAQYAFQKVFPTVCLPIQNLFENQKNYAPGSFEGQALLASICIMILIGMKTMTKFHSFATDMRDDIENFVGRYFLDTYRWQYKKLYRAYEQGLLQYVSQNHTAASSLTFICEAQGSHETFTVAADGILLVNVAIFFDDFCNAVKKFENALCDESFGGAQDKQQSSGYRDAFFRNYEKILAACTIKP